MILPPVARLDLRKAHHVLPARKSFKEARRAWTNSRQAWANSAFKYNRTWSNCCARFAPAGPGPGPREDGLAVRHGARACRVQPRALGGGMA